MTTRIYREDAIKNLELFEKRFEGAGDEFLPLSIARRWARVFQNEPIDMDELARIVREAEKEQNRYEIAFYAFCNDMRRIYHDLWEDFLKKGHSTE